MDFISLQAFDKALGDWAAGLGAPGEAMVKLCLAAIAGGLVGMERELRGRQAGFRTNILVCLGSALAMIVSTMFAHFRWSPVPPGVNINVDPARIAYGIMTGVGFLGAGTIIQTKGTIRGLTTAAAMWCVAAMGLAAGFGLYAITIVATLLVVTTLWVLDYVESSFPKAHFRLVTIRTPWTPNCISNAIERFHRAGIHVAGMNFERTEDLRAVDLSVTISFIRKKIYYKFERELEKEEFFQLLASREL